MKTAVMTGITGFLGARLAAALVSENCHVIGLKRANSDLSRLAFNGVADKVELHDIDPARPDLEAVLKSRTADAFFHTAALARVGESDAEVAALVDTNLKLPLLLAQQAKRAKIKVFVNASTSWQSTNGISYSPFNIYAATKEAFENLLIAIADKNFTCVSVRLFDTYGPGDYRNKIVDLLIKAVMTGEQLSMSPGGQSISLVHVNDAANAFIAAAKLALSGSLPSHNVFSAHAPEPIEIRKLAALIGSIANKPVNILWGSRPYRPNEVMVPRPSHPAVPGWVPAVVPETGLAQVIDYFRRNIPAS